ncbi:hypothetical protein [Pseudomonas bohemica]|uniref:hypothetical protein n=1 Tax=Pseudomonas bohemica TaxID=2044872 RepID=UPI0018FE13A3|nr:hypothetical protein [Pseudomonas bohemica]
MSTSYADSAQARLMDERMLGSSSSGAADNWFDGSADLFYQQCNERDAKRLASLPSRLRICMGQMEAVLAKQGGSV